MKRFYENATLVVALLAAAFGASPAKATDQITFVKAAPWSLDSAQLTFGQELGFFKQEGLDVEFVIAQGSLASIQQILGGSGQVGYLSPEALAASYQTGKTPLPVKLVYNNYRSSIWEFVVLNDSPIVTLTDFRGKTIGTAALTTGNVPLTTAALASIGIGKSDFSFLPVGVGPQAFRALTAKSVDVLNLWMTVHETLAVSGVAIRRIPYPPDFAHVPTSSLVFTDAFIKDHPDLVEKFGRAWTKSTIACQVNREGCVRSLWRAFPTLKPSIPEEEAMAQALPVLDSNLARLLYFPEGEKQEFGAFIESQVKNLLQAVKTGGLIDNADIDLDKIYTNRFVSAFNDFDRSKVEQLARTAK
jgi:NitT/TauT family transport system substrate-binding protein